MNNQITRLLRLSLLGIIAITGPTVSSSVPPDKPGISLPDQQDDYEQTLMLMKSAYPISSPNSTPAFSLSINQQHHGYGKVPANDNEVPSSKYGKVPVEVLPSKYGKVPTNPFDPQDISLSEENPYHNASEISEPPFSLPREPLMQETTEEELYCNMPLPLTSNSEIHHNTLPAQSSNGFKQEINPLPTPTSTISETSSENNKPRKEKRHTRPSMRIVTNTLRGLVKKTTPEDNQNHQSMQDPHIILFKKGDYHVDTRLKGDTYGNSTAVQPPVNEQNYGNTPAHFTTELQNKFHDCSLAEAGRLIGLGAHPHLQDPASGDTLLHRAAQEGNCGFIQWLLTYDSTINSDVKNKENKTAFDIAIDEKQYTIAGLLVERGAQDPQKNTALHYAVLANDVSRVRELLKNISLLSAQNINAQTPLHLAILHQKTPVALQLIEASVSSEHMLPDKHGKTPLDYAIKKADPKILNALLSKGVDTTTMQNLIIRATNEQTKRILEGYISCKKLNQNLSSNSSL